MFNKAKVKHLIMSTNKLDGFYNGTVVDNVDPDRLSRIRVSIPCLTEGIESDLLPWYSIANPVNASPNSKASIPPLGSEVKVEFPTNDIYNGIVVYVIVSAPPA